MHSLLFGKRPCTSFQSKTIGCCVSMYKYNYLTGTVLFREFIIKICLFSNINIIPDEENCYSYIWSQLKIVDASQYYPTVASKLTFMAIELDQVECGTKSGYRMVLDSNHFSFSHALRYSLSNARNLMLYVQVKFDCFFFKHTTRHHLILV